LDNFGQTSKVHGYFRTTILIVEFLFRRRYLLFLLLMPIEILKTKRFHVKEVTLQTKRFHMEGELDIIRSYRLWVHMCGRQFEILLHVDGYTSGNILYFCKNRMSVSEKLGCVVFF